MLIMIFISSSPITIATNSTYEIALNKGTETLMVSQYDQEGWEEDVDKDLEPDDWFGGDSDKIGAKSKITIRNFEDYKWNSFEVLTLIFGIYEPIPADKLPYFLLMFNKDSITTMYPDKYKVWESMCVKWDFESEEFEEEPDDSELLLPIFKDPKDLKEILELYNTWAQSVNLTMLMLELEPYPILSEDEFLWKLALDGMLVLAQPFVKYLDAIIDELDCKNVKVRKNSLIFVKEDYALEVIYSAQGTQVGFVIYDSKENVIYEIVRDDTTLITLISFGVIGSVIAGILIVFIKKRNKFKY